MDSISPKLIEQLICKEKLPHHQVSNILKSRYPMEKGFSERSVRRFCNKHNISQHSGVNDDDLDRLVGETVHKVGPTWGRKMMTGYLRTSGFNIGDKRVGASLARVSPGYHHQRRNRTEKQTNPVPYSAEYFGHKMHLDQNEKLVMYGVVHVISVDGYSGKIISHALMPVKNNVAIYEYVYRPALLTYGLWDQLRVDKGKEFNLILFIQDMLKMHRRNTGRQPYIQTTSKQNHKVERMWVEMNSRVNYPIKTALNSMVLNEVLDMEDEITKFAVSSVCMRLCKAGCQQFIDSWNQHSIPGKGIPNELEMENKKTMAISPDFVPTSAEAVRLYEHSGRSLTYWSEFGIDPLSGEEGLAERREQHFQELFPNIEEIFYQVVNNNSELFQAAVTSFRDLTHQFSP